MEIRASTATFSPADQLGLCEVRLCEVTLSSGDFPLPAGVGGSLEGTFTFWRAPQYGQEVLLFSTTFPHWGQNVAAMSFLPAEM